MFDTSTDLPPAATADANGLSLRAKRSNLVESSSRLLRRRTPRNDTGERWPVKHYPPSLISSRPRFRARRCICLVSLRAATPGLAAGFCQNLDNDLPRLPRRCAPRNHRRKRNPSWFTASFLVSASRYSDVGSRRHLSGHLDREHNRHAVDRADGCVEPCSFDPTARRIAGAG